ncbi:hypothetical protein [Mycobacteroides abscessus]|uniref:hypothetical protein n=1 Tax=Mycobacteroides abscessus TaxID=36809 RepID=UPI0009D597A6|nr:hypothetical protein [Mycobacteroides abscessus]SLH39562.1 Uncharacterised protein [Mycobacteroides abscessus subsp. massiliense]
MATRRSPLAEVEKLTGEISALAARRDRAMEHAKAKGKTAQQIADAASMSPATYYRVMAEMRAGLTDPGRYRDYAPALALPQPADGVTVGIGVDPGVPPLATFTFGEQCPVLLLLQDKTTAPDLWPVMAASAAASDARIGIYGRLPDGVDFWDLPTYLGEWDDLAGWWLAEFEERIARITNGEDLPPMLVQLSMLPKTSEIIYTALKFGHQARLYMIAETSYWRPPLALINAALANGGSLAGPWSEFLESGAGNWAPQLPVAHGTAALTTPDGATEIVLNPAHPDVDRRTTRRRALKGY